MKSMDCHEKYYPDMGKKVAALKDDRYVYPGDPVSAGYMNTFKTL